MEWHTWLAFFAAVWGIALSPGNGAVLCMTHGLNYGLRASTATILGLQLGLFVILLISALGVGALLTASPAAFNALKWAGAAYLAWLGWQQWHAPVVAPGAEPTTDLNGQTLAAAHRLTWRQRFVQGFLTNITNPKGIVFMAAVLPQFMNPRSPNRALEIAILALTMFIVDAAVMHGYAGLAAQISHLMRSPQAMRWQNRIFGAVLVACGAAVLLVRPAG